MAWMEETPDVLFTRHRNLLLVLLSIDMGPCGVMIEWKKRVQSTSNAKAGEWAVIRCVWIISCIKNLEWMIADYSTARGACMCSLSSAL